MRTKVLNLNCYVTDTQNSRHPHLGTLNHTL
jgi:hypothetical protein